MLKRIKRLRITYLKLIGEIVQDVEKIYRDLMSWMVKNPSEVLSARQDVQFQFLKKRFIYGDSMMQTTLMPYLLKPSGLEKIRYTSEVLDGVIEKVIRLYFEDNYVRGYYPIHFEVPKSWMHSESGYNRSTVINRHDILFDGKNLKYIEFNTDNPGGKGWVDYLCDLFAKTPLYQDIVSNVIVPKFEVLRGIHSATISAYNSWGKGSLEKARAAVVTFRNMGTHGDEQIVRDFFIENGIETNIIDPRDVEYRDGSIYSNGIRFDILLRSVKARYFLNYPREMVDFHKGVLSQAACMVNSWRALLGAEKSVISFLSNPMNHHYFTQEEVKVIKDHVPWTRMFDETVVLSPLGEEVSLKSYLLRHKDDLVIKPSAGAGGEGVMVGRTTDSIAWKDTIDEHMGSSNWVAQEYVEIPQIKMPVIQKNKIVIEQKFVNLSPYVIGGNFVGILGRVSDKDVINVSAGGGMIPVFYLKENSP